MYNVLDGEHDAFSEWIEAVTVRPHNTWTPNQQFQVKHIGFEAVESANDDLLWDDYEASKEAIAEDGPRLTLDQLKADIGL